MPSRRITRPIRSAADAAALVDATVTRPLEPETLCIPLDPSGHGRVIMRVTGTTSPDSLAPILHVLTPALGEHGDLVIASVRPQSGLIPGDVDRWMEASELCAARGARLLEWFIVSPRGLFCPRDLLGEPERWDQPSSGGAPWAAIRCARR